MPEATVVAAVPAEVTASVVVVAAAVAQARGTLTQSSIAASATTDVLRHTDWTRSSTAELGRTDGKAEFITELHS